MKESKEALNNIAVYSAIHNGLLDKSVRIIADDIKKVEALYSTVKEKRDNAQEDYNTSGASSAFRGYELRGEIKAYNDILVLLEGIL